jgi:hypothetical protein
VLISFSPANLMRIDNLAHVFWGRSAQFGYFSLGELNEIRRRSRGLNDETLFGPESPADLDAFLKSLFYTIKFPSYYVPALLDAGFENRSVENQKIFDLVLSDRGHGYFGQAKGATTPDAEVGLQSFAPQKIIDEYFNQTLALLNARNIPVYFVAMPHNVASTQLYSPDMNKGFDDYINSYVSRYPHFHILGDLFLSWPSQRRHALVGSSGQVAERFPRRRRTVRAELGQSGVIVVVATAVAPLGLRRLRGIGYR